VNARNSGANLLQTLVAASVVALAVGLALGALNIPSTAGYAGVGPNFLPWLVSVALLLCGGFMLYETRTGGFRDMENPDDADGAGESSNAQPYWGGFVWMSAGLLANAALITTIGFVLSCTLTFVLASRGLRNAAGQVGTGTRSWLLDTLTGVLIATPVYWMFTQFLAINLPGLTGTGWL
jgi:putative tricarboxylic transport membrane protein